MVIGEFVQWMISEYGPKNAEALGYTPVLGKFQQTALTLAKKCGAS